MSLPVHAMLTFSWHASAYQSAARTSCRSATAAETRWLLIFSVFKMELKLKLERGKLSFWAQTSDPRGQHIFLVKTTQIRYHVRGLVPFLQTQTSRLTSAWPVPSPRLLPYMYTSLCLQQTARLWQEAVVTHVCFAPSHTDGCELPSMCLSTADIFIFYF